MKNKNILISVGVISISSLFVVGAVFAEDYGLKSTAKSAGINQTGSVQGVIGNVVGSLLTFAGVLFLILMIYGGVMWMISRGNEDTSKKALNTITAAVIGLIIVTASYAITTFVFKSVNDIPLSYMKLLKAIYLEKLR